MEKAPLPDRHILGPFRFAAPASAFLAVAVAVVAIAQRWFATETQLTSPSPLPFMSPLTAAAILAAAIALVLIYQPRKSSVRWAAGCAAAVVCLSIAWVAMGQHGLDLQGTTGADSAEWALPGFITSLGLACLGAALLSLGIWRESAQPWVSIGAALTLVVAMTGLVGHIYGAGLLYGADRSGGMALSTACALTALALGTLFVHPSRGFAAVCLSQTPGGQLLRRLLPAALLAPLLLGWIALSAQWSGQLSAAFGTAMLVVTLTALIAGLAVRQAIVLNRIDAEREDLLAREQAAREQANNILESITDGFFAVDRNWRFTYLNHEAERLLRHSREELLGRSLWEAFPEAVGSVFHKEYERAVAEQKTRQFEEYYAPLEVWADVRAFPTRDGLSVYFHDITDRRHIEEAIRESELRFRALAENASMAIFVIDEESRIEFANPAVERIFGYSTEEMLGRSLNMLMPPDQREAHKAGMRRYLKSGRRNINWESTELPGLAKDGRIIPLEISFGEFELDGRRHFTGITRDITERKQAEEALRDSEERYRLLADMIPQHIWTTDANGYHTYFSRRWYEYSGVTPEETLGEEWMNLLHPDDREHTISRWQHSLRTGQPYAVEYRFRRADGIYCWFMGQAMPLRDEDGRVVRWFGTLTDISDLKRLEEERQKLLEKEQDARAEAERRREELERVTESRARLMRGFSHDVRNPLSVADGNALLLQEEKKLGELSDRQRESVRRIRRAIRSSLRLIDDLLELARAEAGQIDLEYKLTDIGRVAGEAVDDFSAQAAAAGQTISVRAPLGLRTKTDPARVRQILANLISNAVKYAPNAQVTVDVTLSRVTASRPADWITISVADTGPGIPEDKTDVIFQEYSRLDSNAQQGAGIGLAISRRIAHLLGGDLTVKSEPGEGATFTLWLPATADTPESVTSSH